MVIYESAYSVSPDINRLTITHCPIPEGDDVGGIWSRVNESSGLQINSIMYRFHPAVIFKEGFPMRNEILNGELKGWGKEGDACCVDGEC